MKRFARYLTNVIIMSKGKQLAIIGQRWLAMVPIEAYQTEDIVGHLFSVQAHHSS
jgi:hypothetical protein